jgi:hypothetical protein
VGLGYLVIAPVVEVVLPTFNGVHYLEAQLASIEAQTLRPWRVLLRDDGSSDGTSALINTLQERYGTWLQVLPADGALGCTANVNRLLQVTTAPYVALADQDDLWLPDKLQHSFEQLQQLEQREGVDTPLLVHGDLELMDQGGCRLGIRYWRRQRLHPDRTAVIDLALTNVVTGCTVLLNRALLDQALPIPAEALVHDWWLALVASVRGEIGQVRSPAVLYRQHQTNVVGARGTTPWALFKKLRLPVQRRPPALLRSLALQSQALSQRFGVPTHPLVGLLQQPRWRRSWRLLNNAALRRGLRKHGPLRTWGLWLVLCLASPQPRSTL